MLAIGLSTGVARADVFAGPWDTAHQPPTIASPYVTVDPSEGAGLALDLSNDLTCPGGLPNTSLTVTFADPSGQVVNSFATTEGSMAIQPEWGCISGSGSSLQITGNWRVEQTWNTNGGAPSSSTVETMNDGHGGAFNMAVFSPRQSGPMLYQVADASGVIAQGTWTFAVTPPGTAEVWDTDYANFVQTCVVGNQTIYHASNGHEYCVVTSGFYSYAESPGWPAPASPPAPLTPLTPLAPSAPPAVPAPPPTPAPVLKCVVPKLNGKTLAQAKAALRNAHCSLGHVDRPKRMAKRHTLRVLSQASPGGVYAEGHRVELSVR